MSRSVGTTPCVVRALPLANTIFTSLHLAIIRRCDRMFLWAMLVQWVCGVVLATKMSPYAWAGTTSTVHEHVWLAVFLGGAITLPAVVMAWRHPGAPLTRHVVAVAQMTWSGLLIHITGGRIETHFHVFVSLACLAFYRDWRVLCTATLVVFADHLIRGTLYPEAVYGIPNPEWWRLLEHGTWVLIEDVVLFRGIRDSLGEMDRLARKQAQMRRAQRVLRQWGKERSQELRSSRFRYQSLVESLHAVPFEIDAATLRMHYVGPQAAGLLGVDQQEWLADGFLASRIEENDLERVRAVGRQPLARDKGSEVEFRLRHSDGRWIWIHCMLSSSPDAAENTLHGILVDITDRRRMEEELRDAQKLESVGRLAAGVAHEINTPTQFVGDNIRFLLDAFREIDRVLAATKAIANAPDAAVRTQAVAEIEQVYRSANFDFFAAECPLAIEQSLDGVQRVAKIVYAMKDFAHADTPEKVPVDVNRVLLGAITVCRNEWKYVAEVATDLDPENPTVPGYPGDLGQVIINLVVNAAHAIAERGPQERSLAIQVRSRRDGRFVRIEVEDEGAGIPEHVQGRIFEQFFTTKAVGKGTGQGLALAHRIVTQKHGGQISFTSEAGVGTTFQILLPVD